MVNRLLTVDEVENVSKGYVREFLDKAAPVAEVWGFDHESNEWGCALSRTIGDQVFAIDMWFGESTVQCGIDDRIKQEFEKIRDDLIDHIDRDIILLIEQGKL